MIKILFIPVSSPKGIGEYMRSLIIAQNIKKQWPNCEIQFILSKQANYSKDCPFKTHIIENSPTKEPLIVNKILSEEKPTLVVFDASGRASQFAHAKKIGAKILFLSQHTKKRSRGVKLNRAKYTDYHFVVQPDFAIDNLSILQRLKLKLFNATTPINIGPIFTPPDPELQTKRLKERGLIKGQFILINAGSGGHQKNGQSATDIYYNAALEIQKKYNRKIVFVTGANYCGQLHEKNQIQLIQNLENSEFINLLDACEFAVISGGSTLLQAISLKKLVVVAPVSKDQPYRIMRCEKQGLIVSSETAIPKLLLAVDRLKIKQPLISLNLTNTSVPNGIDHILKTLKKDIFK